MTHIFAQSNVTTKKVIVMYFLKGDLLHELEIQQYFFSNPYNRDVQIWHLIRFKHGTLSYQVMLFLKKLMYQRVFLEKIWISETFYETQENMIKLFNGLEYVRIHGDDLLIIMNKSFEDHTKET